VTFIIINGGAAPTVDDDEGVGERDIRGLGPEDHRAAEYLGVEAPGALDVVGDDEVADDHSLCGLGGFGHWHLRLLRLTPS
jgi:hypothetical protein